MFELFRKRSEKAGDPPGTLRYVGPARSFEPRLEAVIYGVDFFERRDLQPQELKELDVPQGRTAWIRVLGIHDAELVRTVGDALGMHGLFQEDVLDSTQRTKVDHAGDLLFMILRTVTPDDDPRTIATEQVSLVRRGNLVVTFQETARNPWQSVLDRIESGRERLRRGGAEALITALLDAQVDGLQQELALLSDQVRELDEAVLDDASQQLVRDIYEARRRCVFLHDVARPFRDLLAQLLRDLQHELTESSRMHLRDVLDHAHQAHDAVASLSRLAESMFDMCISLNGLRMNQIMKVLTVIATIFIPLTFIAGVYGMNFHNMPELRWHYGYYGALALMAALGLGMVGYFLRRKWL